VFYFYQQPGASSPPLYWALGTAHWALPSTSSQQPPVYWTLGTEHWALPSTSSQQPLVLRSTKHEARSTLPSTSSPRLDCSTSSTGQQLMPSYTAGFYIATTNEEGNSYGKEL